MPFDLSVIRDNVTYSLTAGTPYKLASAEGLAGPAVTRATMRAPGQDGDTDYGYHLEPRLITLAVQFTATSGSVLDGYRDTFMDVFRPERSVSFANPTGDPRFQAHTPLTLQVTRDDGEVRRIDCYATGPADVPLVTEHRPGHLHRAVVTLVAPNPTWYGTATINSTLTTGNGSVKYGTIAYTGSYYAEPVLDCYTYIYTGGNSTWQISNNGGDSIDFAVNETTATFIYIDVENNAFTVNGSAAFPSGSLSTLGLRLAPDPIVAGGTNVYTVQAPPSGSAVLSSNIIYRPRYLSY